MAGKEAVAEKKATGADEAAMKKRKEPEIPTPDAIDESMLTDRDADGEDEMDVLQSSVRDCFSPTIFFLKNSKIKK